MFTLLQNDFMPHGFCIKWSWDLLTFYVVSDAFIFLAYTYIGITLILFARKHIGLAWNRLLWLFAFFVLACGITHLMSIVTFWLPVYWLDATLKSITAVLSFITAAYLAPKIPELLNLHSNEELDRLIYKLLTEKAERKKAELLKENYFEHYSAINDAAVIAETDPFGTITFANDHFCELSGYTKEELLGSTYGIVKSNVHPPSFYRELWQTIQSGRIWRGEICNRHKDGTLYWVSSVIVPVMDTESAHVKPKKYITIRFDITDRKESEQRQASLKSQVNQMQRVESIGRLTSGIAHDFNNVLSAIIGYNQLNTFIAEDCQDEKVREELLFNAKQVSVASQRASNLIKKMMVYSRQDSLHEDMDMKPTLDVVNEALDMVRPALTSLFQLHSDMDSHVNIHIDATALHQILTNLIVNARDAMKQGGMITISLKKITEHDCICHACKQSLAGEFIELSVSDKGTGIDQNVIQHIFDAFFTTKEIGEGTGLGLSTVNSMVHDFHGHVIVESSTIVPHSGTTFRLLFPSNSPETTI